MLSIEDLQVMKTFNVFSCHESELIDISKINIDKSQPIEYRINRYFEDVKNPYLFKVGSTIVKINCNQNGKKLASSLSDFLSTQ